MSAKYKSGIDMDRPEKQPDLRGYAQTDADTGLARPMDKKEIKAREAADFDPDTYSPATEGDQPARSDTSGKRATGPGNKESAAKASSSPEARKAEETRASTLKQSTASPSDTRSNTLAAADQKTAPTKEWKAGQ